MAKKNESLKQNRREQIKAAALELFSQHGYHGTSTEMIIAKARVSKGLLFFHYKNKQELLKAIRSEWGEKLWTTLTSTKDETLEPLVCFEKLLDTTHQTLIDYESEYRLHFSLLLTGDSLSPAKELFQLGGYERLREYLHWLFSRLGVADVENEIILFSDLMLGVEIRFLILGGQSEHFESIKQALMKRYS